MIRNLKIAITGHKQPERLGGSLHRYFKTHNTIRGYSKSDGWDVRYNTKEIIYDSADCDIFINNIAGVDLEKNIYGQVEILKEWYEVHKGKNHVIVNISCIIPWLWYMQDFSNEKAKLPFDSLDKYSTNKASWEINRKCDTAKSIDIAPGMMMNNAKSIHMLNRVQKTNAQVKHSTMISCIEFAVDQYFQGNLIPYVVVANTPFSYDEQE